MVKVRFAPSPTGYLHIGGARTALFNWMYAKAVGGSFVLRVEDTDLQRSDKAFTQEILDGLTWLGLDWDELYYQSDRFDIYREYAHKLLEQGKAYREGEAIILKIEEQEVKLYDVIRGEIVFDAALIKDQVLMKSDGSPTYSFACVIDDALMEITTVIRGEDHISNTPKQLMIYAALGFKPPKYAHLPLILSEDGTRMSKRHGAVAVSDYQKQGYLSEAVVNHLMLLGWSPGGNQEMISMKNAIKKFSLKKINKAAAVFSMEKLKWINQEYIKVADTNHLIDLLIPMLQEKGWVQQEVNRSQLEAGVKLLKRRIPTLQDFLDRADFLFLDDIQIPDELQKQYLTKEIKAVLVALSECLKKCDSFVSGEIEKVFRTFVEDRGLQASELVHPLRIALTGKDVGAGLFETMEVLGQPRTIKRLVGEK